MISKIDIDEKDNSIDFLEKTAFFLEKVKEDINWWKWVIISLHGALYGFMVCALAGSAGFSTYKDDVTEKLLKYYSLSSKEQKKKGYPNIRKKLEYFLNLYERIKDIKHMKVLSIGKAFNPKTDQDSSVEKLNEVRNEFMHFDPKLWVLEINGMPKIVAEIMDIIYFLAFESNNIILNDSKKEEVDELIKGTRGILKTFS
jgi:hypothetical protein